MRVRFCQIGGTPAFVCTARDITEHRRAEAVRREKELAAATLESIAEAVITIDTRGRIVYFNRMAAQLTGWNASQASGRRLEAVLFLVNGETRKLAELPFGKMLRKGGAVGFENHTQLRSRYGQEYAINDSVAPAHTRDANAVVVLAFHEDSEVHSRHAAWRASHDVFSLI